MGVLRELTVLLAAASSLAAQTAAELIEQLRKPEQRTRATAALQRLGDAGARTLWETMERGRRGQDDAVVVLAATLTELGPATAPLAAQIAAALSDADEPLFGHLLRALGNGILDADDAAIDAARAALPALARAGRFYSPAADAPTFTWYEYVRLQRRLALRTAGTDPEGLQAALTALRTSREDGVAMIRGLGEGKHETFDLNAHGQHGQRESLEAIGELAQRQGAAARDIVEELARYLAHEPPRPGIVLTEHCAGIGEEPPADLPAVSFSTLWRRDDWRFACARAVFALHPDGAARQRALRQLLHAPLAIDRLSALEAMREWPRPWAAFADEFAARLDDEDRAVVREALVTIGLAEAVMEATRPALERLARGSDRELAMLARRVLDDNR